MQHQLARKSHVFPRHLLRALVISSSTSSAAFAHHSGAAYDMTRQVSIEGTVIALTWKNPHAILTLASKDAAGAPVTQEIELMSASQANGLGLRKELISAGAQLTVRASPNRRGTGRVFGIDVTTSNGVKMPLSSFAGFSAAPASQIEAGGLVGRWTPSIESFRQVVRIGSSVKLTPEGLAARQQSLTQYSAPGGTGIPICKPLSPPLLHIFPDVRTIEVNNQQVVIYSETNGIKQKRIIHLDQASHSRNLTPTAEGHSIGHWQDKTLVVDTTGFAAAKEPDLLLLPTQPAMHLIEKLTLTPDRRHIDYEFTVDFPPYLVEPITSRATWDYHPDLELADIACDATVARQLLQDQ